MRVPNHGEKANGLQQIRMQWLNNLDTTIPDNVRKEGSCPDYVFLDFLQTIMKVASVSDYSSSNLIKIPKSSYAVVPDRVPQPQNSKRSADEMMEPVIPEYGKSKISPKALMAGIIRLFNSLKNSKMVIFMIDKHDFVPFTKGDEQELRKSSSDVDLSNLRDIDLNAIHVEISDFISYMQDRDKWRKRIIRWICFNLLHPESQFRIHARADQVIVFDGHCLTKEQMVELGVSQIRSDEEAYGTPLVLINDQDVRLVEVDNFLVNDIGESDFLPYFYINHLTNNFQSDLIGTGHVNIYSLDTDAVHYSLIYLAMLDLMKVPVVGPEKRLHITIHRQLPRGKTEWIDVNVLYDVMMRETFHRRPETLMGYIASLFLAGSDFTYAHFRVTHYCFSRAYIQYYKMLGLDSLVAVRRPPTSDWIGPDHVHFDWQAFDQLIKMAYGLTMDSRISEDKLICMKTFQDLVPFTLDGALNPAGKRMKALAAKARIPPQEDVVDCFNQLVYYFRMVCCMGKSSVDPGNPLDYGYTLKNPSDGICRGNVTKKIFTV